jgi:HD-GYP domain-containing protein (c-di-GMP phosphodiesterase class II)/ActR/RegA family two-component response regulator
MSIQSETPGATDLLKLPIVVASGADHEAASLAKLIGFIGFSRVTIVNDFRQVIPTLNAGVCHLVVLDLSAHSDVGLDAIRHIRRQFSAAALPILVLTQAPDVKSRTAVLQAGANDCLAPDADRDELALRSLNLVQISAQHLAAKNSAVELQRNFDTRAARLTMLIENGLLMGMPHDRSTLLRHTLFEGQRLLHCDAASLYLVTPQKSLRFFMRTRSDELVQEEIPLYDPDTGAPNERYISTWCALHKQSVLVDDVATETRFDLSGTRRFDAHSGYRTVSVLTVPMAPRKGELLGVLQFINQLDPVTGQAVAFSPDVVPLVEALSAQAAVALDNLQLLDERKASMESLIRTIATAIDAKSPYTARHSERVPELAVMLAEAAHATSQGPLTTFGFHTDDEWHEFRVGAWLHDCGKITTPEHVIDKATKLETIYNRIHEIRMRFEVLWRDVEIERLQALAAGGEAAEVDARCQARNAQLQDDFAFIAQCNLGGEHLSKAHRERIRSIGANTWLRHFDDRLGLAHEELERRGRLPAKPLPATEFLLKDEPYHLMPRTSAEMPDASMGFKLDVPDHAYNHGEIYNLSISRGTLTPEDRFKINEHMTHGITMLERMPFPKSLQRVPEYAGTHHETLKGTGYPRKLGADDLSVPARIMMIADIFEALTAVDRPYKKPKMLSEAVSILHTLKRRGHIDADVFDLFLTSGVYLRYANKFLTPMQIDSIDIERYLGPVAAAT